MGDQGGGATAHQQKQQSEPKVPPKVESKPEAEADAKTTLPNQQKHHNEPQLLANEYPKLVRRRSKGGNLMTAIEDIQRLPTEVIYQEFDRLLNHAQGQIKEVAEMPCGNLANRLKDCLYHNRQRSCQCFSAMEQYRQCVLRATQDRVDDMAAREPVMIPVVPPQPTPRPANPPQRSHRSWWRPWTWFK
ncbi:uncharacterized protein LOC110187050 [Drosophila serrata]|uniref:uncharacterized protein LOC110187050 n=1 Tax=Drosophila serrata TaxID=7274 RepID=UPI000A1D1AB8|nr:uncharacterized protein LOC110187050 [Drosophila serrata]